MRITELRVQKFKSLLDTRTIQLSPTINVLTGANNAGKSTILRAIGQIQTDAPIDPTDVRLGHTEPVVTLQVDEFSFYYWSGNENSDSGKPALITVTPRTQSLSAVQVNIFGGSTHHLGPIRPEEPRNYIYPYMSRRKATRFHEDVNERAERAVGPDLRFLAARVTALAQTNHRAHEAFMDMCRQTLGFHIGTFSSENGRKVGLEFDQERRISLDAMGEGVASLVGLISQLCVARDKVFLIEELENDVHPQALKSLLELIIEKSATNQFFVSTHSHIVAKYLASPPDSALFNVSLESDGEGLPLSVVTRVPNGVEPRLQVLRQLGYEFSDLDLWDGWLILEESTAERLINDHFIPWFASDLSGRLRTMSAGGTSKVPRTFLDFHRAFLFAHLSSAYKDRAWVILDGDPTGLEVSAKLRESYSNTWKPEHFLNWTCQEFEDYYPDCFDVRRQAVRGMAHGKPKQEAKLALLNEVLAWIKQDPKRAESQFESSASEVIRQLRSISRSLA